MSSFLFWVILIVNSHGMKAFLAGKDAEGIRRGGRRVGCRGQGRMVDLIQGHLWTSGEAEAGAEGSHSSSEAARDPWSKEAGKPPKVAIRRASTWKQGYTQNLGREDLITLRDQLGYRWRWWWLRREGRLKKDQVGSVTKQCPWLCLLACNL